MRLARAAGGRLGWDRNDYETYFGPAKVTTESVHAAVKLNDPVAALDRAGEVPGNGLALPTAARGRHLLDVARAEVGTRQYGRATETLLAAERLSPEWMRHQVLAGVLVGELMERHRRLPAALKAGPTPAVASTTTATCCSTGAGPTPSSTPTATGRC